MTIATSRNACCAVTPAMRTSMHTNTTPIKSMAITRSGSVGPIASLMKVKPAATASIVSATRNGTLGITCSAKYSQDAAFEAFLDLLARGLRCVHVHHVNVKGFTIRRHVEGDAAGRRVDQHRQQQDLPVLSGVQWQGDDARLHIETRCGDIECQPGVCRDALPEEIRGQTQDAMDTPNIGRWVEHTAPDQREQNDITKTKPRHQRLQGELSLERGPRQRQKQVTEQHASPPLQEQHGDTRSYRAIVLQPAWSRWIPARRTR